MLLKRNNHIQSLNDFQNAVSYNILFARVMLYNAKRIFKCTVTCSSQAVLGHIKREHLTANNSSRQFFCLNPVHAKSRRSTNVQASIVSLASFVVCIEAEEFFRLTEYSSSEEEPASERP